MTTSKPNQKNVIDELTVNKFSKTSNMISGTSTQLQKSLKELETEIRRDKVSLKEYETYKARLDFEADTIRKRIEKNKAWIENFEAAEGAAGSAEQQYRALLDRMELIYNSAKDLHGKGIEMLIKDFNYHLAFKRWNDSFSAVPFKPK